MKAGPTRKRSRVANVAALAAVVAALTGLVVMRRVAGTGSPANEVVYQLGSALIAGGVVALTFMLVPGPARRYLAVGELRAAYSAWALWLVIVGVLVLRGPVGAHAPASTTPVAGDGA